MWILGRRFCGLVRSEKEKSGGNTPALNPSYTRAATLFSMSSSSSSYPLFTMRGGGDDYFDSDADSYIAANAAAGVVAGGAGNAGADIATKRKLSEASGGGGRRSAASSVSSRTSRRSPANVPVTTKTDKTAVEVSTKKPKLGPISNADGSVDSDDDDDDKSFDGTTRVKEHDRRHATWSARGNLNFQTYAPTGGGGGGTKTIDVQTNAPRTIRLNSISESDYTRAAAAAAADGSSNKLSLSSTATATSSQQQQHQQRRWRSHQMAEDYISLASSITLPPITSTNGPIYGHDPRLGQYPIEQITTLGYLTSSLRRPQTILERWNPYEISLFEGAIAMYGKKFHTIAKYLQQQQQQGSNRKCTKDVIEFYYIWKKTSHGRRWKTSYVNEILDSDDDADDEIAIDDNNNNNNRDVNNNDDANAKKEVEDVSSKSNGPVAGGGGVERGVV